jgi:hypothetical protein
VRAPHAAITINAVVRHTKKKGYHPGVRPETRRKALQQTARIAFGASVLSCAPSQPRATEVEVLPTASATATPSRPVAVHQAPPAPSCAVGLDADGGILKGSVDCCLEATSAAATKFKSRNWSADRPDLATCCRAIAKAGYLPSFVYESKWPEEACFACAEVLGNPGACTPWGPPMPPAMA